MSTNKSNGIILILGIIFEAIAILPVLPSNSGTSDFVPHFLQYLISQHRKHYSKAACSRFQGAPFIPRVILFLSRSVVVARDKYWNLVKELSGLSIAVTCVGNLPSETR